MWIFRSFGVLLKLNGGIFNLINATAGIENLIYFLFPICPCSVFSAQPYLLLQQTWWKTLWRTSGIFIVAHDRISIRVVFFPASPELAWILPSCVTSSKLKLWDDQHCHSGDGWNDRVLILNQFNCTIAKYKVIEEGFFGMQIITSLLQLSCLSWLPDMLCLPRQHVLSKKDLLRNSNNLLFLTRLFVHL